MSNFKNAFLFLTILILFSCTSTKKNLSLNENLDIRIFGEMTYENDSTNIPNDYFFIYLTDKKNKKIFNIFEEQSQKFDLRIKSNDLKKYKKIVFATGLVPRYEKTLNTDSIPDEFLNIKLEKQPDTIPINIIAAKPAIYLYPISRTQIKIIHQFKGKIVNTYPIYNNGWNVIAEPNGKLLNNSDNREYNYLFWDGILDFPKEHYEFKEGFVVENEKLIEFFQNKLEKIGLTAYEINDFIVYWLPILNQNEYNIIRFRINDNIDESSFLEVIPKPDTQIRVFMEFKGIKNRQDYLNLKEQYIVKIQRDGFTLVEWGGANIDGSKIE
jgi:hypothetical protein